MLKIEEPYIDSFANIVSSYGEEAPYMLDTSLNLAFDIAKGEKKLLFVFIIDRLTPHSFLGEVVCSEISRAYFNEFCLAWGWNSSHSEDQHVRSLIDFTETPHIAAFNFKRNRPTLVGAIHGCINIDMYTEFIDRVFSQSISP